jgi:DNA polymerase-1
MKKFIIIDGNAYVYRSYYAIPALFSYDKQQVNAVYGFIKFLFKIINKFKPDYISVCFDHPSENFRKKMFKNYKNNRKPIDESLRKQILISKKAVNILNIKMIEKKGYEADDLIATLTKIGTKNNLQIIIVTGDKDIFQLIDCTNIFVWDDSKNIVCDEDWIKKRYQDIKPKQLVDVFSIMGDSSDNIRGINGIGEKTALKLIKKFGNIENILSEKHDIKLNFYKLFKQYKDVVLLNKKLIKLNDCVKINYNIDDFNIDNFKNKKTNNNKVINFFKNFGFKSLVNKYFEFVNELK